jgi:hypothetical protein
MGIGDPNNTAANRARCNWRDPPFPFFGNDHYCVALRVYDSTRGSFGDPTDLLTNYPDVADRRWVLAQGLQEIRTRILGTQVEAPGRRLAVEVPISVIDRPDTQHSDLEMYLDDILAAAVQARVPVMINLDTVNFIRPDVSTVVDNVERSFTEDLQVSWRNWGSQQRVMTGNPFSPTQAPAPNLASNGFRQANQVMLARLLPKISAFYASLAPADRYLFAGLVFGTEISVGVNAYYYPNGNSFVAGPAACDPGTPWTAACPTAAQVTCGNATFNYHCPGNCSTDLAGGLEQIGYKAATALNLLPAGQRMTHAALDGIVTNYLGFLAGLATSAGVPAHKITAHVGGMCGQFGPHSLSNGRVSGLTPGYSVYFDDTPTSVAAFLGSYIQSSPAISVLPWSSPEWQGTGGTAKTGDEWATEVESSAQYFNNRMVILANWDGGPVVTFGAVQAPPAMPASPAMQGLGKALSTPAAGFCALTPSLDIGHATFHDANGAVSGVGLMISNNPTSGATYLNVSSSPNLTANGTLATVDIANAVVTPGTSYLLKPPSSLTAYVQLVTDGCSPGKRIQSPVVPITLSAANASDVPYPRFFSRTEGGQTTFSWDTGGGFAGVGHAEYLTVTTDPTFATVDTINQVVTNTESFTRALTPGLTYYGRLVADAATRRFSNVVIVQP